MGVRHMGRQVRHLVVQSEAAVILDVMGNSVWTSNTWSHPVRHLVGQSDAKAVIHKASDQPTLASNTWGKQGGASPRLLPNERLTPGQQLIAIDLYHGQNQVDSPI